MFSEGCFSLMSGMNEQSKVVVRGDVMENSGKDQMVQRLNQCCEETVMKKNDWFQR